MAFQQGLSGLNAASKALDVTSNNVSNSGTVGFKSGQAHFADVYANSLNGSGTSQTGIGTTTTAVQQQFTQGNITTTSNSLDISINGSGFYRMNTNGAITYSRSGQFHLDKNGYVIDDLQRKLTGYLADTEGNIIKAAPQDLLLSSANQAPAATGASGSADQGVFANLNFDSRATAPTGTFDTTIAATGNKSNTYNFSTATTIYDTLGNAHTLTIFTAKTQVSAATTAATAAATKATTAAAAATTAAATAATAAATAAAAAATADVSAAAAFADPTNTTKAAQAATDATAATAAQTAATAAAASATTAQKAAAEAATAAQAAATAATAAAAVTPITADALKAATSAAASATAAYNDAVAASSGTAPVSAVQAAINAVTAANDAVTKATTRPYNAAAAAAYTAAAATYNTTALPAYTTAVTTYNAGATAAAAATAAGVARTNANPNSEWLVYTSVDGTAAANVNGGVPLTIKFDQSGTMVDAPAGGTALTINLDKVMSDQGKTNIATPLQTFNIDFSESTQFGSAFGTNSLTQDGYTSGRLTGVSVSEDGIISGNYSNGKTRNLGQVALAAFTNPNGLSSVGGNQWVETDASGTALVGTPNSGTLGVLKSSTIEESNVDLTAELVNMITQQRAYQASAQTIKTQDQIMNTLVNLR
jgi:flagellar hook protein FlgE